jgi:hypothetical protein
VINAIIVSIKCVISEVEVGILTLKSWCDTVMLAKSFIRIPKSVTNVVLVLQ